MRFDAVLFDLDGTLLDSIALILASHRHTLEAHGYVVPPDARLVEALGMPLEDCFARFAPGATDIPAMVETYRAHNVVLHDEMVRAYPGVSELVGELDAAGARLGVVTSKRRPEAVRGLERLGIASRFDVLVCAGESKRPKPHPDPVVLALERLGVAPERGVFVGDSTHDMDAGRAAGVATLAVLWGPFTRDALAPTQPTAFAADVEAARRFVGL